MKNRILKHVLYVGLNDKDTKTQLISDDAAKHVIAGICKNCTISEVFGSYVHEDGTQVTEKTLKIELLFTEDKAVLDMASDIKATLNQESIALEKQYTDSILI